MGGQFADGYIIGIVGIALSLATVSLKIDAFWAGLIASGSLIGILIGSLISGLVVDRFGRKSIYVLTVEVFVVVSVLQYFVHSPAQLLVLRVILGIAIGADYAVSLSLMSELSPKRYRARMMSAIMVAWYAGFVTAYIAGLYIGRLGGDAWKLAFVSCAVPAAITLVVRLGTPESPLWLLSKGRVEDARQVVVRHFGEDVALPILSKEIKPGSFSQLFGKKWRRSTFVGSVFYFCQVIPLFALGAFIPRIMEAIEVKDPSVGVVVYNVSLFVGVFLGLWVVGKISRRAFLAGSFYFNAAALAILTFWGGMPAFWIVAIFCAFALVMSGSSVLEYVYLPELFPTELRGSGIGFSVAMSRVGGAGATFLLPIIMSGYGVHITLGCCVAALAFGGVICHLFAPEPEKNFH
ncbi:MFS transporter [Burkholderia sp. Ac-20379]|nr:MFS transporter [Burkholderia sp. Ac-20379]